MQNSSIALTDTASQIAELQRRQKLAEALSAQGAAPIEVQSYKGIQAPISPFSALAKVLQTYMGAKQAADAIKGEKEARKTAREEAVGFLQGLDKTATPDLVAPTGAPEMINTGVPTANFTPASGSLKDMRKQLGTTPDEIAAAKGFVPPAQPVQVAQPPIMQAPGIDGGMAGAPMVRAVPGPVDNAPALMPMASAPSIQAPQLYGNEQAPVEVNTPQQKMAMLMQAQMSGNPYLEQMAPALYGEIKGQAKAKKVFDAIGDISKEYGGDPRIMAGIVAAGDPNAGIDYLMKLGASAATAKQEMAKLIYTATEKAEENKKDRENRLEALGLTLADRQAGRDQASSDRQFLAGLVGGRTQTAGTVNLRKEFNALPEVKTYKQVSTSYQNLKSAAKLATPAGDQAMIFGVMKMLDPQSVVRESEQATVRNAGSIPDKVRNLYNYTVRGNKLNDAQRQDFVKMADGQFNNYKNQYTQSANAYRGYATDSGYDPDKIVSLGDLGSTQSSPAAGGLKLKFDPKTGKLEPVK